MIQNRLVRGFRLVPDSTGHDTEQVSQGVQTSPDSTSHGTERVSQGVQGGGYVTIENSKRL